MFFAYKFGRRLLCLEATSEMEDATAPAGPSAWGKPSRAVRASRFTSGHQLRSKLSLETLALVEEDANSLFKIALIGFAPSEHPSRLELQEWLNVNLVEPNMIVTRIRMLQRGYFLLTFATEEGASAALQQSPLNFGQHLLYLHPWRAQFNPKSPQGIKIPLWVRFPHLDDVYYRALREISSAIGEVAWSGRREDSLRKASTPRVCVLVVDVNKIPSSIILPIPKSSEEVEIILEYEGIPAQCPNCLQIGHN